jgi:hypothetical protein
MEKLSARPLFCGASWVSSLDPLAHNIWESNPIACAHRSCTSVQRTTRKASKPERRSEGAIRRGEGKLMLNPAHAAPFALHASSRSQPAVAPRSSLCTLRFLRQSWGCVAIGAWWPWHLGAARALPFPTAHFCPLTRSASRSLSSNPLRLLFSLFPFQSEHDHVYY